MEKTEYTLKEAADILGWNYERLKTMKRRGKLPIIQIPYGEHRFRDGITLGALRELQGTAQQKDPYLEMKEVYLDGLLNGSRPATQEWTDAMERYLERYWGILGVTPSILGVNASNLKAVLSTFKIDRKAKKDYYSTKKHFYTAITGLMDVLVEHGYKKPSDTAELRKHLPKKVLDLKKPFLDLEDVEDALRINKEWKRPRYELRALDTLIRLYAFVGARKMEAADLTLDRVHLDKNYVHIFGKYSKERIAPTFPDVSASLAEWIEYRDAYFKKKGIKSKFLVPQSNGSQLTRSAIQTKFERFRQHIETEEIETGAAEITPHALRRSCATIMEIKGMPPGLIQRMLGHKHASTTEGYKMTEDRHLIEWAQNFHFGRAIETPPTETESQPTTQAPAVASFI